MLSPSQIVAQAVCQLWPAWAAMLLFFGAGFALRRRLGLFGRLFESGVGVAGLSLLTFWLAAAILASALSPFDPLHQVVVLKNALPGSVDPASGKVFLFGGVNLGRDVFTRMIFGSRVVLVVAPLATAMSLIVGILLGVPAGYLGGRVDALLSFVTNLIMAFPIIVLFYLLVSPGILNTPIPYVMAGVLFQFPAVFFLAMIVSQYRSRLRLMVPLLLATLVLDAWLTATFVFDADPFGVLRISPTTLNIFVTVAFVSSPSVFRIVRGLVLDIRTRDYVAAAQTRGETSWYVMMWEILPNARGPLIVDACLRIGYTTIFLGALGYFGLGLPPESPDWGTSIKDGSRFLRIAVHPVLPPALALMSFVLGLNLLADALREQSLKD